VLIDFCRRRLNFPIKIINTGVSFTSPLVQSANALAHWVWHSQFHQQNCTQIYPYTQQMVGPTFLLYSLHCVPMRSKKSQKLLVNYWWNWPRIFQRPWKWLVASIFKPLHLFATFFSRKSKKKGEEKSWQSYRKMVHRKYQGFLTSGAPI